MNIITSFFPDNYPVNLAKVDYFKKEKKGNIFIIKFIISSNSLYWYYKSELERDAEYNYLIYNYDNISWC